MILLLIRIKPVANIKLTFQERTYTHTDEKKVELYIDLNKITHSYTAQYSLTKFGKLLDKVFVCLQEPGDTFGRVKEVGKTFKIMQKCICCLLKVR